jgi:hypothetical protein
MMMYESTDHINLVTIYLPSTIAYKKGIEINVAVTLPVTSTLFIRLVVLKRMIVKSIGLYRIL